MVLNLSSFVLILLLLSLLATLAGGAGQPAGETPLVLFGDTSRLGRPFAKDPSVVRFGGRYLMYYSIPPYGPQLAPAGALSGWAVGIAESKDLIHWTKAGEMLPEQEVERNGMAAPGARVLDGKVHLFYQTYGNGPKDAICHAVSSDGLHFQRDPSNPVFRPTGKWNVGRAIDAEVFEHQDKLLLYYATRDPQMKIQMVGVAAADRKSDFGRETWTDLSLEGPALKPELPWERDCIEAATVCRQGDTLYMFYAGAYNNAPQQIGCATSRDGIHWTRLSPDPLVPNGPPGTWNASESGHPGVFVDDDGQTYLFFQGNNDKGRTWFISCAKVAWREGRPTVSVERKVLSGK